MPPRKPDQRVAAETLGPAMGQVVASDPEIRELFRSILRRALKDWSKQMAFATPEERSAMMKMLLPHALKELAKSDAAAKNARQAEAWERMRKVIRGEVSADELGENPFVGE